MQYIQTYFQCLKNAGYDTMLEIHRMQGDELVEKCSFDHVFYDGASLMTEMARKFPADGFKAPALLVRPKPSLAKRLWELFKWYVRFYPFLPPRWQKIADGRVTNANGKVLIEEWRKESTESSVNSQLLFALDLVSHKYLTNAKKARIWMTPVGLYEGIPRDLKPMNRVSFIDLKFKEGVTLSEVHKNARKQLSDLNYWGTMLTMNLPNIVGRKLFTNYAKSMDLTFRRTGTFTNLGEWQIPGLPSNEWWSFGGFSVAPMTPVAGTAVVVNGKLAISAHFHPCVGLTNEEAQSFVEEWRQEFLKINQTL